MADQLTAKLICVFVFTYAKSRFSHDAAHVISNTRYKHQPYIISLKFNRGNMAYVIIILFINIKLFIDRHLSKGFPVSYIKHFCKCIDMIFTFRCM